MSSRYVRTLATLSVRDRAIIVLNDHRFWGYASGPSSSGNTLPSSIHCWHGHAARRSALPRERFSLMAQSGGPEMSALAPLLGAKRKSAPALIYVCKPAEVVGNLPSLIFLNQGGRLKGRSFWIWGNGEGAKGRVDGAGTWDDRNG
jgi:hypothetical protein